MFMLHALCCVVLYFLDIALFFTLHKIVILLLHTIAAIRNS